MTVKELIEKLQQLDPNAKITLEKIDDGINEVADVYTDFDGSIIISEYGEV